MATSFFLRLATWLALCGLLIAIPRVGAAQEAQPGPVLTATIVRGDARLPLFRVPQLRKGDTLVVQTESTGEAGSAWLMVLATVTVPGNRVDALAFNLQSGSPASITIQSDDQVPVIVLAPQVKTMFGLSTSFDQSATLIMDAIKADPQRFVELQRIDKLNHVIASLTAGLDAIVASKKPERAVDSAKEIAAKFGVKNVDTDCFKANVVNTTCVATSIVSNKNLSVPSLSELSSLAGPFAAQTLSADMLANVRLVSAAGAFISYKYRDQYDFAPSSGQQVGTTERLQLFSNARFKNGDIKTAYVYVPSWFSDKQPQLDYRVAAPLCLLKGAVAVDIKGVIPLSNYWHSWQLELRDSQSAQVLAQSDQVRFRPESGTFVFDAEALVKGLPLQGQQVQAVLQGKFGFADVQLNMEGLVLPHGGAQTLVVSGAESLVSEEDAALRIDSASAAACVSHMVFTQAGQRVSNIDTPQRNVLMLNLRGMPPGEAILEVAQFGVDPVFLPVQVKPRKARVSRVEHFDQESEFRVYGDYLNRIDSLRVGAAACVAVGSGDEMDSAATMRIFVCPTEVASNAVIPAKISVLHRHGEPDAFETALTKLGARPRMVLDDKPASLVHVLSPKAVQWGLGLQESYLTDDTGLGLLFRASANYQLARGNYVLQIKFADDPQTEQTPLTFPLMENRVHNELRTRGALSFTGVPLPSIVNALWFRIQHKQSGLSGDWLPVNRAVLNLPNFGKAVCDAKTGKLQIQGSQLFEIDWASNDMQRSSLVDPMATADLAVMDRCAQGLCLAIDKLAPQQKLRVKVHWVDDRLFDVYFADVPVCPGS
jgi:hypothetical protein